MYSDLTFILQWWFVLFLLGVFTLPITISIFSGFFDRGYVFSKILGIAFVSYIVFLLGTLKILPFTQTTILLVLIIFLGINIFILKRQGLNVYSSSEERSDESRSSRPFGHAQAGQARTIKIFLFEEILFLSALAFWSYIRGSAPDIHGLEKYMDFGFINSMLRGEYFPPLDMWFTPFSVNYYYFGHLTTAVLTKISGISSTITFNLMVATVFAFTFVGAFSIGTNLIYQFKIQSAKLKIINQKLKVLIIGGMLTAFLVSMAGNLHTIYTFFTPYQNEHPEPIQQLSFSPSTFPNNYWYPNSTRFIYNTIHEFPIYSFVVSDLHGHVLDIPFVLLTIAILLSLISKHETRSTKQYQNTNDKNTKRFGILSFENWNLFRISNFEFRILLLAFLLAIMYMTNVWDGTIYALLTLFVFLYLAYQSKNYTLYAYRYTLVVIGFFLFSLPFNIHFKPFVSGIGILCAPDFLTKIGHFGPFLFEVDHCQHSPFWQLLILYGFFYFWVLSFLIFLFKNYKLSHLKFIENLKLPASPSLAESRRARGEKIKNLPVSDIFVLLLILLSTLLIIIPEFIYAKDIYPAHYRANTMFKLVYQSFMMLSICCGYIITRIIINFSPRFGEAGKFQISNFKSFTYWKFVYCIIGIIGLFLIMIYSYFAITSYYGNLNTYYGLDGTLYLQKLYPNDYKAIVWLNEHIKGQPVILEAQGDSYTDFARVSTHTGLPTLLGWTVHEWLWRGTYDIPSPRIEEVKTLYETSDLAVAEKLISKHKVKLIFIGDLEHQKYPLLYEQKFSSLGRVIFKSGQTKIYQVN